MLRVENVRIHYLGLWGRRSDHKCNCMFIYFCGFCSFYQVVAVQQLRGKTRGTSANVWVQFKLFCLISFDTVILVPQLQADCMTYQCLRICRCAGLSCSKPGSPKSSIHSTMGSPPCYTLIRMESQLILLLYQFRHSLNLSPLQNLAGRESAAKVAKNEQRLVQPMGCNHIKWHEEACAAANMLDLIKGLNEVYKHLPTSIDVHITILQPLKMLWLFW